MSEKPEIKIGKVESGIPMPTRRGNAIMRWPFEHMKEGDSFPILPCDENIRSQVYRAAKARKIAIVSRPIEEGGIKGVRFWRVAPKDVEPEEAAPAGGTTGDE